MKGMEGQQLDISFPENKKEDFGGFLSMEERKDTARMHKSLRPDIFFKQDGKIYIKEFEDSPLTPVEDWDRVEDELDKKPSFWFDK